jgi:signal transduction histidine kinase
VTGDPSGGCSTHSGLRVAVLPRALTLKGKNLNGRLPIGADNIRDMSGISSMVSSVAHLALVERLRSRVTRGFSLRAKVLVFTCGLVMLMAGGDFAIDVYSDRVSIKEHTSNTVMGLATSLAQLLTDQAAPIKSGRTLVAAAQAANLNTDVDDVYVLDREGNVVAESHENGPGHLDPAMRDPLVMRTMVVRKPTVLLENSTVTAVAPIVRADDDVVGYVVLRGAFDANLHKAVIDALTLAGIFLIVGSALAIGFSIFVTRPVAGLREVAARIAHGEFDRPVALSSHDEFAILGTALNRMMTQTATSLMAHERTQKDLKMALKQAESGSRAKSEFLAGMSHELRTPLNAIIGFSDLLVGGRAGAISEMKVREYARDINLSGRQMLTLVSDLLDYARLDGGETTLTEGPIDIEYMVGSVISEFKSVAEAGGVSLSATVAPDLPMVRGDGEKLRRAIGHLVSNAIRLTSSGGFVEMFASLRDDRGLVLGIADNGGGGRPGEIEAALVPFSRLGRQVAHPAGGVGLGLPLARKLIELHQGELCIDTNSNVGTIVTVYLPRERSLGQRLSPPAVA